MGYVRSEAVLSCLAMAQAIGGRFNAASGRGPRLALVVATSAAIVALTWFLAQQQAELEQMRADAAASTSITITVADSRAHLACERIENHSNKPVVVDLRSNGSAKPVAVRIAAQSTTDVCVDYANLNP